jgi:outer membrane protein assembly factor BamB
MLKFKISLSISASCIAAAVILLSPFAAAQEQTQTTDQSLIWPNFRGPNNNGVSTTAQPPTTWSDTENIAWKQKIPGKGSSSPIVINNRVYITAAAPADPNAPKPLTRKELIAKFDEDGDGQLSRTERRKAGTEQRKSIMQKQKFIVLCYDRASGDPIWQKVATEALPHEAHHPDHGYASASPVTDGQQLYVNFGSFGLYCYDLEGNLKWKRDDLGKMATRGTFGEGSSVAVHDNIVVLPWDQEGQSRIEAFNSDTGETIWKTMRDEPTAWATPLVVENDGRTQIIHSGQNYSRGYDLQTGEEIWKASGLSQRPVSCPTVFGNVGFFASARGGAILQAIPLNQRGDISANGIAWTINKQTPDVPSLLLSENRLYFTGGNSGILTCVNAETGKPFFSPQRLPIGGVYSSPVAANGNVFITGRDGKTVVVNDAVTFGIVSTNDIGEPVDATLALADEEIFIRGRNHLFCVRNQ